MKFAVVCLSLYSCGLVVGTDDTKLSKFCMDGKNHKNIPSPESSLRGECEPWKNRACCSEKTTLDVHQLHRYDFKFNHCPSRPERPALSQECEIHFKRDTCFYECEPNVEPWIVQVNRKTRKERFFKVPLCASECDKWYNACKSDFTCAKNWAKDFEWINGTNICTEPCVTFEAMHGNAKNFCETVWDHSWEYTDDSEPCMKMWFDPKHGNPNDVVFLHKLLEGNASAVARETATDQSTWRIISLVTLVVVLMLVFCLARVRRVRQYLPA